MMEESAKKEVNLGQKMQDGSVYAGLTADGKQEIYAMPRDLFMTMTFNDAASCVKELNADNALGHNDWQIPALEILRVLKRIQNKGSLKETFNTTSSGGGFNHPDSYWSSTEDHHDQPTVWFARFSDSLEVSDPKDNLRLSCRPVRLVAAPGS